MNEDKENEVVGIDIVVIFHFNKLYKYRYAYQLLKFSVFNYIYINLDIYLSICRYTFIYFIDLLLTLK